MLETMKTFLVSLTTIITVITALLLDYGAKNYSLVHIASIAIVMVVIIVNFIKFKLWGYIHKQYHLSDSYPAVAIFFPIIYLISIIKEDAVFELSKIVGVMLILLGLFFMRRTLSV
jgi:hypothetical protein